MEFKTRLMIAFVAFIAAGVYVNLFSGQVRQKVVEKIESASTTNQLESATTNEVVALLGKPFRTVDSTNFVESVDQMAEQGYPVSNADMRAKGMVWLYPEGRASRAGARRYQTVFFDQSNRVCAVCTTFWMDDLWGK